MACPDAVTGWNDLLLNPIKNRSTLRRDSSAGVAKLDTSNGIAVSVFAVPFSSTLRVLGVTLSTKKWHSTTTSPELCDVHYDSHACGIYVRSSTRTPLTPLCIRWNARDWTTATLFCMESRSKTSAASNVSGIRPLESYILRHTDRPLHVSVAACTGSQFRNE